MRIIRSPLRDQAAAYPQTKQILMSRYHLVIISEFQAEIFPLVECMTEFMQKALSGMRICILTDN